MVDPMLSRPNGTTFEIFPTNLSRVMEKFDAVIEKLTQTIKGQAGHDTIDAASSPLTVSDDSTKSTKTSGKESCELDVADSSGEPREMHLPSNPAVGFEGDILQLKDRLSSATRKLQVIPIVRMGGIGKTTLARSLYDDPFIRSHFDARAWVTLSQNYSVRAILLDLLRCVVVKLSEEMQQESNVKLALVLHQSLCGRRYLVVVDDIWNKAYWDEIKRFFPEENHRSRILCVESDDLPPEILRLRNLQTLIVKLRPMDNVCNYVTIPSELWDIPELRHFKLEGNVILLEDACDPATQEKLQTLSFIALSSLISSKLLSRIPNIKKLEISSKSENANLGHLHHLESLRCRGYPARTMRSWDLSHARYVPNLPRIEFPRSIRKLTLDNYMMPRSFTSTVGSLPHLQFFRMEECRFDETDADWELSEGEFGSLRYLELYGVNLVRWKGADDEDDDDVHFPRLRHLVVVDCDALEGIPSSFGDIAALEKIELDDSNPTDLVASVRRFEVEQHHNGNESLQIFVYPVKRQHA